MLLKDRAGEARSAKLYALVAAVSLAWSSLLAGAAAEGKKKIVFLPGRQSHGWGGHAYGADCALFAKLLNEAVPEVEAVVVTGGWPKDLAALDGAAAIVIACDGNGLIGPIQNYRALDAIANKGVGLAFIHYALDVGKENGAYLLDWIGGFYDQFWSVNPSWTAEFITIPDHPITRGVRPFKLDDEWYYHMRFREGMRGVTPILSAVPPERTRQGKDGPHSGNPEVRKRAGMAEHVAWAYERPDGGRGFGYTGGHTHWNYAQNDARKLLLNAFCWVARVEVPAGGVRVRNPTVEEMEAGLEGNRPADWPPERTRKIIEELNASPGAAFDPEFRIQGEYEGFMTAAGGEKVGVQVVASPRGAGQFDASILPGGLPGAGWDQSRGKTRLEGKLEGAKAVCGPAQGRRLVIDGATCTIMDGGAVAGTLKKVVRASPTLGKAPPPGAVVLFDGTNAAAFEGGRMDREKLLMQGCESTRTFGDHIVHIEFRLPFEPRNAGQGRGNSGMYLQGRYEVQMLDSFGLEGKMDECGGIYSVGPPKVNMCFPPLSWQTYDVQFTAARFDAAGKKIANPRMTVFHNGVLIHDDIEIAGKDHTTAAPEKWFRQNREPAPGPIYLQDHGNPVRYRNIWAIELTGDRRASLKEMMKG